MIAWGMNLACCLVLKIKFYWNTSPFFTHHLWHLLYHKGRAEQCDRDHMARITENIYSWSFTEKCCWLLPNIRHACIYNSVPSCLWDNTHFCLNLFSVSFLNSRANFDLDHIKSPSHITWDLGKQTGFLLLRIISNMVTFNQLPFLIGQEVRHSYHAPKLPKIINKVGSLYLF